jgi:uncharacterized membrane protein
MDLAWYMSPPWDIVVIVAVLAVAGAAVFYLRLGAYHRRYFFDKALQLALITTLAWLIFFGGAFALVFWLVSFFVPAGWLRIVVGVGVWWLLNQTVLTFGWEFVDRWLNALLG